MDPLIASIEARDLSHRDMKTLIEVIGLDAVKKLLSACAGMTFYVPTKMPASVYQNYILANFRQGENNVGPLAKRLRISERQVYRLLKIRRRGVPASS